MAHIYIWLPKYGLIQSKRCKHCPECRYSQDGKSTDPFCHVSLTLASSPSLLFPFFFSLSLSPLLSLYFISVISHEPGIAGNSVLGDCLRRLSSFFGGLEPDIAGNSVSGKSFPRFFSSFLLVVGYEPDIAGNSVSGDCLRQLFLFLGDLEPDTAGNSVSGKSFPRFISSFHLVIGFEPGIAGNPVSGKDLRRLFLAFFEDSDPGIAGNSVPDRNLQCSTSSFLLVIGYEPDILT